MKIERTKNATRNIIFGVGLKIYQILIPFVMRTVMIYFMGLGYVGLSSLFASVLQVLNLAELGVGSAMVYSMYKPIVEDDKKMICALMKIYRLYYRIIGTVVAVCGICILPMIPKLVKGEVPGELNIYYLYLLHLGATVLSYWLFAYKNCLLDAHQRMDVTSKVTLITNTIQYGLQLFVLIVIKDYYLYLVTALLTQALTNIVTAIVATRMYPDYHPTGILDQRITKKINQRIRDLFTSKVGSVVLRSADTIVISTFLGLTTLAVYQNYYFILNSVISIVTIVFTACTAGIGNSLLVESNEKNMEDFKKFTFLICWLAGFCTCALLCLYQPFIKIWVGTENMLGFSAVICFCIYYFLNEINQLFNLFKDAGGIWHEDRFRPLITAMTNLLLNLIMVQFWGIYGVLLSTVLSMLVVGMPWLLHNLFTVLFPKKELKIYLKELCMYIFAVVIVCVFTYMVCGLFEFGDWGNLFFRMVMCCIVPNILFYIFFRKSREFEQCLELLERITKGKIALCKIILKEQKK